MQPSPMGETAKALCPLPNVRFWHDFLSPLAQLPQLEALVAVISMG